MNAYRKSGRKLSDLHDTWFPGDVHVVSCTQIRVDGWVGWHASSCLQIPPFISPEFCIPHCSWPVILFIHLSFFRNSVNAWLYIAWTLLATITFLGQFPNSIGFLATQVPGTTHLAPGHKINADHDSMLKGVPLAAQIKPYSYNFVILRVDDHCTYRKLWT